MDDFRPRIVAFLCNWCSYAGADLAGTTRLKHRAEVRIIVGGCHPGDCHYVSGNLNARRRFLMLRSLLEFLGIEKERFQVTWCSAVEGEKWARVVDEVCDIVERLGAFDAFKTLTGSLRAPEKEISLSGE
jgi:F420-non-reducing hydrogenase iron-sulfur subunit